MEDQMNEESEMMQEVAESQPKAQTVSEPPTKVSFEVWYSLRNKAIPVHHRKEVIKADFNGRKVPSMATLEEFDVALRRYGIKI